MGRRSRDDFPTITIASWIADTAVGRFQLIGLPNAALYINLYIYMCVFSTFSTCNELHCCSSAQDRQYEGGDDLEWLRYQKIKLSSIRSNNVAICHCALVKTFHSHLPRPPDARYEEDGDNEAQKLLYGGIAWLDLPLA